MLVDTDMERVEVIRGAVGADPATSDYREVLEDVDGVIIATPHHLQTPIIPLGPSATASTSWKPISNTASQVDEIIAAAAASGTLVTVKLTGGFYASLRDVQRLVTGGGIGEL